MDSARSPARDDDGIQETRLDDGPPIFPDRAGTADPRPSAESRSRDIGADRKGATCHLSPSRLVVNREIWVSGRLSRGKGI